MILQWLKSRSTKQGKAYDIPVANFGKVAAGLYRGAAPSFDGYSGLFEFGIRTVIDLRDGDRSEDMRTAQAAGIHGWLQVPMSDKATPRWEDLERALSILTSDPLKPVYVHCAGGRHRTGLVVACYRVRVGGWTKEQAWDEAREYGWYSSMGHSPLKTFFFEEFTP